MSLLASNCSPSCPVRSVFFASLALVVSACGGGSGGGSSTPDSGGGQSPPTVSLSANPTSVTSGGTTTLSWSTTNADTCTASGGWSGSRSVNGSAQSGALSATTTFTLSCNGPGGGAVARATVSTTAGASPSVQLTANPPGVAPGGTTSLSWTATNVTSCTASGGWSGVKALTGSETSSAINADQTYQLSCTGTNGNAVSMTTVTLRNAALTWTAPTKNVDGSALTNLSGYKVYWGTASRSYSQNANITGAGTTTYTTGLSPGTWYFAISALDATGAESAKSNEVSKTVF